MSRILPAATAFTKAERKPKGSGRAGREHMARVARLGCIVCRNEGLGHSPAEIHHIKHQVGIGRKSSDFDVLPLCPNHHRAGPHGVAYHAGPVLWEMRYGRQTELLDQVRRLL